MKFRIIEKDKKFIPQVLVEKNFPETITFAFDFVVGCFLFPPIIVIDSFMSLLEGNFKTNFKSILESFKNTYFEGNWTHIYNYKVKDVDIEYVVSFSTQKGAEKYIEEYIEKIENALAEKQKNAEDYKVVKIWTI